MSPDPIDLLRQRRSATVDLLWEQLREAEQALDAEPILAPLFVSAILQQR